MALSVTATVDDALELVRFVITGGTAPYVLDAQPSGGRGPYRVRTAFGTVSGAPSSRTATDGDIPLNTPTIYVATDATGAQAQSAAVQVTSSLAVISDATNPSTMLPVVVVSQPPNEWAARSVWWDILGATAPFVSVAPMRLRSGDLVLRTDTPAQRAALIKLLSSGNPFILRSVTPDAVDDVVALAERVSEQLVLDDAPAGARHFEISYQAVTRQLGIYTDDTGRTYAVLTVEAATYAALLGLYGTYDAVRLGDPSAGLGVEQLTDGAFVSGPGAAPWSQFWTSGAVWSGSGVATGTATNPTALAIIEQQNSRAIPAGPKVLRVAGRVRSTSPSSLVQLEMLTNLAATGTAAYFSPGVTSVGVTLTAGPVWSAFVVDLAVTDLSDDVWSLYFRTTNMPVGAVVEWDDLSARWRT